MHYLPTNDWSKW